MSAAGKRHMHEVAQLPCVLCLRLGQGRTWPVEVHHLREGQGKGRRASDFLTIPACPDCHRGPQGIHGDRTYLRIAKCGELDLLADTIQMLTQGTHA